MAKSIQSSNVIGTPKKEKEGTVTNKGPSSSLRSGGKIKVVIIAGGTGGYTAANCLSPYSRELEITHIVGTWDSGGGSAQLMASDRVTLPTGDVAQGVLATANISPDLATVFRYRDDSGQSIINLHLAAYERLFGNFQEAIKALSQELNCQGKVFTVSLNRTLLEAQAADGTWLTSEHVVDEFNGPISKLELKSHHQGEAIEPNPEALQAISQADVIIIGPGSFYTSVSPNFLIPEFKQAIIESKAHIIGIANLANDQHTGGWTAHDYGYQYAELAGRSLDYLLANSGQPPEWLVKRYLEEQQDIVVIGQPRSGENTPFKVVGKDLISKQELLAPSRAGGVNRSLLRHPQHHLSAILLDLFFELGYRLPW